MGFDDSYTDLMIYRPSAINRLREVLEEADINQVFVPGEVVAYSNDNMLIFDDRSGNEGPAFPGGR